MSIDSKVIRLRGIKRMTVSAFIRFVPKPFIRKGDLGVPIKKVR